MAREEEARGVSGDPHCNSIRSPFTLPPATSPDVITSARQSAGHGPRQTVLPAAGAAFDSKKISQRMRRGVCLRCVQQDSQLRQEF